MPVPYAVNKAAELGGRAVIAVREEIFGPVLTVQTFDDEEEALSLADHPVYGLAGGVFRRHQQDAAICTQIEDRDCVGKSLRQNLVTLCCQPGAISVLALAKTSDEPPTKPASARRPC